jgi:hypothetical protein
MSFLFMTCGLQGVLVLSLGGSQIKQKVLVFKIMFAISVFENMHSKFAKSPNKFPAKSENLNKQKIPRSSITLFRF